MNGLRILTIRQPWAWAVAAGYKSVENRTRNIAGDYRGPVAIHAARVADPSAGAHPELARRIDEQWRTTPADAFTGMPKMFGHIIAVATLWAVHRHDGTPTFRCCPNSPERYGRWAQEHAWHLCFAMPRALAEPIPYVGALGMRRLDEATAARVMEAAS